MNNSATIMVVDDDPRIRDLLCTSLKTEGFTVLEAGTSAEAYQHLEGNCVDLVTMDVLLNNENGLDIVRDMRKLSNIPIILVTGRIDLIDAVVGLELGADDYIRKPFRTRELIARVRSVLRRSRMSTGIEPSPSPESSTVPLPTRILRFGNWTLIPESRELRDANDAPVNLTATEYDLLELLVSNPQRVLSRDQLMDRLTGRDWHPNDRLVDNYVAQLRKKIEQPDNLLWIKTVRGAGYMFTGKTIIEN